MEYEFYIDVFFLIVSYLNLLSLFLSAAFLRRKIVVTRLVFAALIGSFWNSILVIVPFFSFHTALFLTVVVVGGGMLAAAFRGLLSEGIRILLRAEVFLFLAAGLVNSCYSFFCQHYFLTDLEGLAVTGLICLMLERFLRRCVFKRDKVGDSRYRVSLHYRGKEKQFLALVDSGNRLRAPGSGKPVSLISYKDCGGFCETVSGGIYIPYHAVGTEKGTLFAVQFEKMEIERNGKYMTVENPIVAIVKGSLSTDGDFSMILPEAYVPEGE